MKIFSIDQLAQGIREKHVGAERARLVEKWSRTGLLRGLDGNRRETMAQLLENQAAQVLKESASLSTGGASMTSSGQIQGFSNIAFPIVRRVFGGLVANELVSIQPMSLPSGLIFYLDYTYGSNVGGDAGTSLSTSATTTTYTRGQSIYNNPPGKGVQSGSLAAGGMYDLVGDGYSKVHLAAVGISASNVDVGSWGGSAGDTWTVGLRVTDSGMFTGSTGRFANFDPQIEYDLSQNNLDIVFIHIPVTSFTSAQANLDMNAVDQLALFSVSTAQGGTVGGGTSWGQTYQAGNPINSAALTSAVRGHQTCSRQIL